MSLQSHYISYWPQLPRILLIVNTVKHSCRICFHGQNKNQFLEPHEFVQSMYNSNLTLKLKLRTVGVDGSNSWYIQISVIIKSYYKRISLSNIWAHLILLNVEFYPGGILTQCSLPLNLPTFLLFFFCLCQLCWKFPYIQHMASFM